MIQNLILVALGGAIGSVARFLTVTAVGRLAPGWPWGTWGVNVAGSFAMGVLFIALAPRPHWSPLLMAGILGGFTTFSAFSLDALRLWQGGQPLQGLAYVVASVVFSLIAVALGAALARGIGT